MKILLINPLPHPGEPISPRLRQPLDLLYVAATLRARGHMIDFIDQLVSPAKQVSYAAYDALVTTTSPLDRWQLPYRSYSHVAALVRKARTAGVAKIVVTGPHGTVRPHEVLRGIPGLQLLVRGEPEETVPELLAGASQLDAINGLAWKDRHGRITVNPERPPLDFSNLPFPAFDLVPMERYRYNVRPGLFPLPFAVMESARGCPFACLFCLKAMYGGQNYRPMATDKVVGMLLRLKGDMGVRSFYFHDQIFNLDRDRTHDLCRKMTTSNVGLYWACACRVKGLDQQTADLMARAGCRSISFGIETLSPAIWTATNKLNTLADVQAAHDACKKAGIHFHPFYSEGHPGESRATVAESLKNAWRLRLPHPIRRPAVIPVPGTRLFDAACRAGLIPEGLDWEGTYSFAGRIGTAHGYRDPTLQTLIYGTLLKIYGRLKGTR